MYCVVMQRHAAGLFQVNSVNWNACNGGSAPYVILECSRTSRLDAIHPQTPSVLTKSGHGVETHGEPGQLVELVDAVTAIKQREINSVAGSHAALMCK